MILDIRHSTAYMTAQSVELHMGSKDCISKSRLDRRSVLFCSPSKQSNICKATNAVLAAALRFAHVCCDGSLELGALRAGGNMRHLSNEGNRIDTEGQRIKLLREGKGQRNKHKGMILWRCVYVHLVKTIKALDVHRASAELVNADFIA